MLELVQDRLTGAAMPPLNLVAGAAALAALTSAAPPKHLQPAAYVIPVSDAAGGNEAATGVIQRVTETVGVAFAVGNLSDRRGEAASNAVETVRRAVRTALVGWQPDAEHTAMTLARGRAVRFADGTVWWLDEYRSDGWLRSA